MTVWGKKPNPQHCLHSKDTIFYLLVLLFRCRFQLLEFSRKLFLQLFHCLQNMSKTVCWETCVWGRAVQGAFAINVYPQASKEHSGEPLPTSVTYKVPLLSMCFPSQEISRDLSPAVRKDDELPPLQQPLALWRTKAAAKEVF